ncbi:polysaccharide deacetylase family protein [Gramella sp. AN32]|uniref:Polysaccharide deacetylase family protein n=1 Tax=Christiangramia antarctica TaxID=2058158 RepID=A0ABW5WYS7_9FLAO|nr:polysaccharide deacetylase family protein [Gramella sp. AN32]MCM4156763.1 polysaccharide deacetylase family protein [Gramella sp. AN32]
MPKHKSVNIITIICLILVIIANLIFKISIYWVFGPLSLYVLLMLFLSTNIQLNYFVKAYHKNPAYPGKNIALSFDDGPVPNTLKILDVLDQHSAKVAFFCVGKNIQRYPEIFKEIISRGHVVGNHTYSHTRTMGILKAKKIVAEIEQCDAVANKVGGVKLKLYRPPFGVINPKIKNALEKTGHQVIGWSVRPYDAVTTSADTILNRITRKVKSGDLIILHDPPAKTPELLEQLLVNLEKQNFGVVRPDVLFDINAYT